MFGTNDMEITLYLVGTDKDDAQARMFFDSEESAQDYQWDNPGTKIFSVQGMIDFTTIEEV